MLYNVSYMEAVLSKSLEVLLNDQQVQNVVSPMDVSFYQSRNLILTNISWKYCQSLGLKIPNYFQSPMLFASLWLNGWQVHHDCAGDGSYFNSLAPGRFGHFRWAIFKVISLIDGWAISCKIALRWMSLGLSYDKSTLAQIMAWCHQVASHYLLHCWLRFMLPYGLLGHNKDTNISSSWENHRFSFFFLLKLTCYKEI